MPGRIHKPNGARDHGAASEQQTRGTVAGPVWRQLGGGRGEADGTVSPGSAIWLSGAVLARMLDVCSKLCGRAGRARRPRRYGLSRPVMMKLATSQVVRRMRLTSARVGRRGGLPRTRAGVTNRCVWRPCTRSALPSLARCTRGRPRRRLAEASPWRLRCRPTVPRQCYRLATASLGVGAGRCTRATPCCSCTAQRAACAHSACVTDGSQEARRSQSVQPAKRCETLQFLAVHNERRRFAADGRARSLRTCPLHACCAHPTASLHIP